MRTKLKFLIVSGFSFLLIQGCNSGPEFSDITVEMTPEKIALGEELYMKNCSSCHGKDGSGDGPASATLNPKPRDLSRKSMMMKISDGRMFDVIKQGGVIVDFPQMPANPHLKDDEIKAIIAFTRSLEK